MGLLFGSESSLQVQSMLLFQNHTSSPSPRNRGFGILFLLPVWNGECCRKCQPSMGSLDEGFPYMLQREKHFKSSHGMTSAFHYIGWPTVLFFCTSAIKVQLQPRFQSLANIYTWMGVEWRRLSPQGINYGHPVCRAIALGATGGLSHSWHNLSPPPHHASEKVSMPMVSFL